MPIPKKGESEEDFVARCIPYVLKEGTAKDQNQASGMCYGIYRDKKLYQDAESEILMARKVGGFESPEPGNLPEKGKRILANAYASCRAAWVKDHPGDRENQANKTSCAKQAWAAVANAGYTKMKNDELEMVEIKGKEIAYPGTFQSQTGKVTLTENDIDEMITHYNNGEYSPYLNLDHDDELTDKVKESLKVLRLGTISKLYKVGKRIVADFKEVPKKIANFIDKGLMNLRSIEYSKNFNGKNGKLLHNVLKAVSFFGADVPAIAGLADAIPTLYEQDTDRDSIKINFQNSNKEENQMDIDKTEYENLLKTKVQVEKLQMDLSSKDDEIKLVKDEIENLKTENKELKDGKEEVEKMKAAVEKKETDMLKGEAETYIDKIIADKKLLPKFKDMKVSEYIRLKSDEDAFKLFKEELESRGAVEVHTESDIGDVNTDDIQFKQPTYDSEYEAKLKGDKDMENAEKVIEAYMKTNKCDWNTAVEKLGILKAGDMAQHAISVEGEEKIAKGEVN